MRTKDGFDADHPLPLFLTDRADERVRPGTSRILKTSILVIAVAAASALAITLSLENPMKVFADATASLTDELAVPRIANQSTPTSQSAADAPVSAPTPGGAPARDEMAAVPEPANQAQAASNEPPPGTLLGQFQAWAANEDAQAQEPVQPVQAAPAQEPVQAAPAQEPVQAVQAAPRQVEEDNPAPEQPMQKHRKAKSVQNARAEVRHVHKPKARVQREPNAPGQAPPPQVAHAQEQPVQNAQPPSFLQSLGLQHQ